MPRVQLQTAIRHNGAHVEAGEVIDVSAEDAALLRSCGHDVEAEDDSAEPTAKPTRRRRGANTESEQ